MKKTYNIISSSTSIYKELIKYALNYCDAFTLVTRKQFQEKQNKKVANTVVNVRGSNHILSLDINLQAQQSNPLLGMQSSQTPLDMFGNKKYAMF